MDQVEQEFGKANPNAPAVLSRFAFLIGRWQCEARVRLANGQWQTLQATWLGRFILDGYAIADEYRMRSSSGELIVLGMNLRTYDASKQIWNIKWLNALTGTWVDLGSEELGGVTFEGNPSSTLSKSRWPRTLIRAPLTRTFPKNTSRGAVSNLTTGRRGVNSWWLRSIVARVKPIVDESETPHEPGSRPARPSPLRKVVTHVRRRAAPPVKDRANSLIATPAHRSSRWSIFLCLGLSLAYPFYSVPVQRAAGHLAPGFGTTGARALAEGAIWLYLALVVGVALLWERRPLAGIGLRKPTLGTIGLGLGGAVALFLVGQVGGFVVYTLLRQPAHADSQTAAMVEGSVVYAIALAVRAGVIEETLFRGLAIEQLTTLTGNRLLAAGIALIAFILVHMLRFDLAQLVPISMVSIVLTGFYLWRRDLMANIIAHAVLDGVGLVTVALQAHVAAH